MVSSLYSMCLQSSSWQICSQRLKPPSVLPLQTHKLPCPSHLSAHAESVISEKTTSAEKEKLLADYEDRLASYES
jgi:hypothetical protein